MLKYNGDEHLRVGILHVRKDSRKVMTRILLACFHNLCCLTLELIKEQDELPGEVSFWLGKQLLSHREVMLFQTIHFSLLNVWGKTLSFCQ